MTIIFNDEKTWPPEIFGCLEKHHDILYSWEAGRAGIIDNIGPAYLYEQAHYELRDVFNPLFLKGYHCTKLINGEMEDISQRGMSLQNLGTLSDRIDRLIIDGVLSTEIGNKLKSENQANDNNRAQMLWFCFFPPIYAGEMGIERFFRSWGGEALYNSHESDQITGPVLLGLGTPCIIEANVSISSLAKHSFLTDKIARVYLKNRGLKTQECCHFESYSTASIPATEVQRVIKYPEQDFINLTGCSDWREKLPFPKI